MSKKRGLQTVALPSCPAIAGYAAVAGKKEGQGPLGKGFDLVFDDTKAGQATWEKAESEFQKAAIGKALTKAGKTAADIELLLAGDLLNQCISSGYAARELGLPFYGLYGACSTMAESLSLGSMLIDGGFAETLCAMTSSHFCSAERQYRTPLEYGNQRTPTAQWTASGAGAVILSAQGEGPFITHITTGRILDWGIRDANNMGAAMAPAAYDTITAHFNDTGRTPADYDMIVTGDLGLLGMELVLELFKRDGIELRKSYRDCGVMLFDLQKQDVHCGGSGCGCSALVLSGHILPQLQKGTLRRVLFCGTGALHSPVALGQGESIPGICHAVAISTTKE